MKVLVADGHAVVRKGIVAMLTSHHLDATIVEAEDARRASQIMHDSGNMDLAFFDLDMPHVQKFSSVSRLRASMGLRSPLVAVSALACPHDIDGALAAGASGYVLKSFGPADFHNALEIVLSGQIYVPSAVSRVAPPAKSVSEHQVPLIGAPIFDLTLRQRETLELVAEGLSNKEIARRLGITEGTVRIHIGSLLRKLGVRNRTQAARVAIERKNEESGVRMGEKKRASHTQSVAANVFHLAIPRRSAQT